MPPNRCGNSRDCNADKAVPCREGPAYAGSMSTMPEPRDEDIEDDDVEDSPEDDFEDVDDPDLVDHDDYEPADFDDEDLER